MTQVGFYHLTRMPLERALPKLLEKTLAAGKRAVVMAGSTERVAVLDVALWTYDPNSWLPHGTARDGQAERQPVWLTTLDENPNGSAYLFLADGATSGRLADYERCFDLFDGRDEAAVAAARGRWTACKAAGHEVAYWKQTAEGGWEKGG